MWSVLTSHRQLSIRIGVNDNDQSLGKRRPAAAVRRNRRDGPFFVAEAGGISNLSDSITIRLNDGSILILSVKRIG